MAWALPAPILKRSSALQCELLLYGRGGDVFWFPLLPGGRAEDSLLYRFRRLCYALEGGRAVSYSHLLENSRRGAPAHAAPLAHAPPGGGGACGRDGKVPFREITQPETATSWHWRELQQIAQGLYRQREAEKEDKLEIHRLEAALDYAKSAEEGRRQLVSNLAHELKTPLAVIHSYAEGLKEHIAEDKREKYLSILLSETERMDAMVLEMLDLSRLEAGKVKLARTPSPWGISLGRPSGGWSAPWRQKTSPSPGTFRSKATWWPTRRGLPRSWRISPPTPSNIRRPAETYTHPSPSSRA